MRAAVLELSGQPLVVVDDVEIEAPGVGEVAVAVAHCGICHSDLSLIDGELPALHPDRARPRGGRRRRRGRARRDDAGAWATTWSSRRARRAAAATSACRGEWSICLNSRSLMTVDPPRRRHPAVAATARSSTAGSASRRSPRRVITEANGAVKIARRRARSTSRACSAARCRPASARCSTPPRCEEGDTVLVMGLGGVGLVGRPGRAPRRLRRVIVVATRWPSGASSR